MPVLISDPFPVEVEALLQRRRETGADRYDEVWEGVLHIAPAPRRRHGDLQAQLLSLLRSPAGAVGLSVSGPFNVGDTNDCRVPDGGLLRPGAAELGGQIDWPPVDGK
jgi:hypothetical protein